MYDDDYGCGGCLTLLIIAAFFAWLSDNWVTILLVVVAMIAIAAVIAGIKSYQAKAPEREATAKSKAEKEAAEKTRKERESYERYFAAQEEAYLYGKLDAANAIVRKLFDEKDEAKRLKILAFFDKYLPLVTEIIEASKHGATDVDESLERFTQTVKSFSKSLYKVDDVVDTNNALMESMAIRDGYYDPYAEAFSFDVDDDTGSAETKFEEEKAAIHQIAEKSYKVPESAQTNKHEPKSAMKTTMTVFDVEQAMQDRLDEAILLDDFDTIREMLDGGVISEFDIDDDVLEKVETSTV